MLVEGVRAVAEAMRAEAEVRFALCSPRVRSTGDGEHLVTALSEVTSVQWVSDQELSEVSATQTPQGVLAVCPEPSWAVGDVAKRAGEGVVLLDGIQDPGNVGTLVRTACGFAVGGIIVLEGTADPWGSKAVRAAAGAVFHAPVVQATWTATERALADFGIPLFLADPSGVDAGTASVRPPWALALGNEGAGSRAALRTAARAVLRIPMAGPGGSLNVAVAGAILMYILKRGAGAITDPT